MKLDELEQTGRAEAGQTAPACILVVDDQQMNIQVVGSVLGSLGYEIIPASDGATAFKRLALMTPDLILLDLLMPGVDGIEVCRQLKAHPDWKNIPVMFLSAADDKDLIVRALDSGGVDYITKPFNQAELISRVRTQLALKSASDQLRRLAEDKDELLGILAHDLKNHLGGMHMSSQLLHERIEKLPDQRASRLAENIVHTSGQLLAFVKEFLANAAADHGIMLNPAPVNLAEVAASAVHRYEEAARRKHLVIHSEFPPRDALVLADATALDQIVDNLLSNAVKFSPPGKSIFISVSPSPNHVECLVRDEGPGFTPEDKERMFRRYVRLSARPTGGEPSTGLGLSIVHKLVRAMKGELDCESVPEQGAVFRLRLPRPLNPH
jgi:two-component system sensor histidine kinase/response regulator